MNFNRIQQGGRPEYPNSGNGRGRGGGYGNRGNNNNNFRNFQNPNYPNNNIRNPYDPRNGNNSNRNGESRQIRDPSSHFENRNRNPGFPKPNNFVSSSQAFKSSFSRKREHDSGSDGNADKDNNKRRRDSGFNGNSSTGSRGPTDNQTVSRVLIPQDEHPEINFAGLLIGQKGLAMKDLETETGARIIIRGKQRNEKEHLGEFPCPDEPLHAHVFSRDPEAVKRACERINGLIQQWIRFPETYMERMKNQLRWVPTNTFERPAKSFASNYKQKEKFNEGPLRHDSFKTKLNEPPSSSKTHAGPPKPKQDGSKHQTEPTSGPTTSRKDNPLPSLSSEKNRGSSPPTKGASLNTNRQQYSPPPREMFWEQGSQPSY